MASPSVAQLSISDLLGEWRLVELQEKIISEIERKKRYVFTADSTTLLAPTYDYIDDFSEGFAMVVKNGKAQVELNSQTFYIDQHGKK